MDADINVCNTNNIQRNIKYGFNDSTQMEIRGVAICLNSRLNSSRLNIDKHWFIIDQVE